MQTPDAVAARKVAAIFLHGTHNVRVNRWGALFVNGARQEPSSEVAVLTAFLLECVGSEDVQENITARMADRRCQFRPVLKRVLGKANDQVLALVGQVIAERELT
jgi:hypothetical protein